MFYRPGIDDHGLPHNPFKAIVAPRPIGWISSLDAEGRTNLAPYSFFNGVGDTPPMVMFATTGRKIGLDDDKDSITNILETGEFCTSVVSSELRDAMNLTSGHYPRGEDEFALAGLTKGEPRVVKAPFVAESPASMECRLYQHVPLPGGAHVIIAEVVGIHIQERFLRDGILDVTTYKPLARLGYQDYCVVENIFSLKRPGEA